MKALDRDLRARILRAVDRGEPMPSVAARFEVGYSTVKKLKYRQRDTGSTEPLTSRCGRKRLISPEDGERLAALARAGGRTLELLRAELGLTCSLTTVWKELRRRGLSHQKKQTHAAEQNRPDVAAKREAWRRKQRRGRRGFAPGRLVFVDETGAKTDMTSRYGWGLRSGRVVEAVPHGRWQTTARPRSSVSARRRPAPRRAGP